MVVEFKVKTINSLKEGFKITGRYGDKGVISKICDNAEYEEKACLKKGNYGFDTFSEMLSDTLGINTSNLGSIEIVDDPCMYYTEDGRKIDICFDVSGAIRRLNTGQVFEVDLNFASERIRQYICTLTSYEEKINIIFEYIGMLNEQQLSTYLSMYKMEVTTEDGTEIMKYDLDFQKAFVDAVEKDGFYIVKRPSSNIRYFTLKKIYERFKDILQPYQLYIDAFGIKGKKVMKKAYIGEKYILVLKQTSAKNFSSRSFGRVNKAGLPAKSSDKKENRAISSNTPVKIGESYIIDASTSTTSYAKYSLFARSSPIGRKELGRILTAKGNPVILKRLPIKKEFTNVNVQIQNARFKAMGFRYKFITDKSMTEEIINQIKTFIDVYNFTFFDAPCTRNFYVHLINAYNNAIRNGATRSSEATWKMILTSQETIMADIPKYVVSSVRSVTYQYDLDKGYLDVKEEDAKVC